MGLLTVGVPDGLVAGDEMSVVAPDGNTYTVMVPPGVEGGMSLEVDLPGAEEPGSSAAGMQQVEVVVPDGVGPGEAFSVEFDGVVMDIICPDDCSAGSAILVEMPAADNRSRAPPDRWFAARLVSIASPYQLHRAKCQPSLNHINLATLSSACAEGMSFPSAWAECLIRGAAFSWVLQLRA